MPYFSYDDIAQIGTPPGPAKVGALRLSGPNAFAILAQTTEGLAEYLAGRPERGCHPCSVLVDLRARGEIAPTRYPCPARAFLMPAPASYTREDVAELHLPGGPIILRAALAALVRAGARPAGPGEFTFRAFRNGRLSLGQAEAVEEVIRAANDAEARRALKRLGDRDRELVESWRDKILDLAARVEAVLDFAEEEVDEAFSVNLAAVATALEKEGCGIGSAAPPGGGLPEAALVGRPNAGKSSLYNALLADDHALVSPTPSTTRDRLRRDVRWQGTYLTLADTPGVLPENEGNPAGAAYAAARHRGGEELSCWVVDASRPLDGEDEAFVRRLNGRVVLVLNKADLPSRVRPEAAVPLAERAGLAVVGQVRTSAATGEGVEDLRGVLARAAAGVGAATEWNHREILELASALSGCRAAARELAGGRYELAAEDLREAATAFSRTLGEGYAEETLTRIFSSFCIGK